MRGADCVTCQGSEFEKLLVYVMLTVLQGSDFEKLLVYLVRALVKLRCYEAIQGLYAWCKDVLNRKLNWMKSAVEIAAGR